MVQASMVMFRKDCLIYEFHKKEFVKKQNCFSSVIIVGLFLLMYFTAGNYF